MPGAGAVFTATYRVPRSADSAGALFIATLEIAGSPAAALAATQVPVPLLPMRAMPLVKPAGFAPVTINPKNRLPAESAVSGVLMYTVESNWAGVAA